MTTIEFGVLGPVQARAGGGPLDLGPARQRDVLAALVVDAGAAVTVEGLIDRVWNGCPPAAARAGLYSYVTRLRRVLAGHGVRLEHGRAGYRLSVDPARVDLHRFTGLLEQASGENDDEASAAALRAALRLWRAQPLAGMDGAWAEATREALVQRRLAAVLALAPIELRLGRPEPLITDLRTLVSEHPLVEPLYVHLMRALRAAGRGAEALDCFTAARERLADELGARPGAELQALHLALLRGDPPAAADPAPQPGTPGSAAGAPAPTRPAHLPPDLVGFVGRAEQLARLDGLLDESGAVVLTVLSGTAGVGKTTLAVHWAHRVAGRFPDGQLYVNLRGFGPVTTVTDPGEAVRGFLSALGVTAAHQPAGLDAQVALYRSMLAGRRMLVVLDNARDAEQVRPLLPGTAGCVAVVTSREPLTGLVASSGAHPVAVALMSVDEGRDLLVRRLGVARVTAEPQAVEELIGLCAGLPLALAVVAARAATRAGLPLAALAAQVSGSRLDALADGDPATDVRAVLASSYRALSDPAAALFRLLGLHPGPDIATAAAASLAGLPPERAHQLLGELARANLVTEHRPGRYTLHDLLRAYATERAHSLDSAADRRAAVHRMLDHYLRTAHAADQVLHRGRPPAALPVPVAGVTPEELPERAQAQAWLAVERAVLSAVVDLASATGFDNHAVPFAYTLMPVLNSHGYWHDLASTQRAALTAAARLGDPAAEARSRHILGRADARLVRYAEAAAHYRAAITLYQQVGDRNGEAHAHHNLAWVANRAGQQRVASHHAWQALDLFAAPGPDDVPADDHTGPLVYRDQALRRLPRIDDPEGRANVWESLGYHYDTAGDRERAIDAYRRALELRAYCRDSYGDAHLLKHLGASHREAGQRGAAREAWRDSLAIFDRLGHSDADAVRTDLHALESTPPRVPGG